MKMPALMTADEFLLREFERLAEFKLEIEAQERLIRRTPRLSASAWFLLFNGELVLGSGAYDEDVYEEN
jgi:hypothetical protein